MTQDVVVIIGVGGMGLAIARRVGSGRKVLLADFNEATLEAAAAQLRGEGHLVTAHRVDVSDRASVAALADTAAAAGRVTHIACTAGLSPVQASTEAILNVDLLGVAHSLDEFARVVAPGGAAVVIASMAGHFALGTLPVEAERALAATPTEALLDLPFLTQLPNPGAAYSVSKRANHLRVQAAAAGAWAAAGARVNSISPGVISTPMGQEELAGESGAQMRAMVDASATKRLGTPDDIAAAAAFLLDPQLASFITGTDLLVDGGAVAGVRASGMLG